MPSYLLDDLADLLSSGGIATTTFKGFMPERPDEAILLVETGGFEPIRAMSPIAGAAVEERPTVQIMRRSVTFQKAVAEMNVIWRMLDGFGDRSINGTPYKWIAAQQSPFPLPEDASGRKLRVCNFLVCKGVSTGTST